MTEEFLGIILVRFDTLIRKSAQSISPAHKTMIIDIISAAFLGLVKYTQRVQELELKIDLYSSASADELTKLLDMQQADFCSSFAEFSYGESVTAPIKQARSQKDAHYHVFKERARQILVNFLSAQDNFARRGVVCRDAFAYFLARWSAPRQQQRGEEGGDSSDQEGQSFWGAQLKSMSMQQLGPASSLQAQARYISAQQVEIVSMQLTLRSPLLARMPNRLHLLLHHLMNDSKGSDKSRVLRVVKDIAVLKPEILPLGFLRRVGDDLLLDDNANVRASAVDLLSTVCLGKMRNAHDDSDTKETFEALIARKGDVSVKVRQAVFAFLQEVTLIARPRTPLLPFESYAGLVGAHINKHTDGNLVSGRVISFDRKAGTFKLEFGMPDNTSTSENEYQEATFDELKSVLVLKTDESDAILGDASRGFVISHRFVSACCQLCSLILSEEESISKLTQSALHELWFAGQNLPPVNTVLEEIVAVVNSEVLRNNSSWFEGLLSQLPEHAGTRAQQYVDLLFGKLCAIENISPISSPGSGRPSNFNDFDSRARLLLPVLQALKLFAKKMPALVFPHLSKMLPVLSTSEVSKDHLAVLRALQEILCDSVCCHKELSTDNVRCLKRQVEEAESEKQHTSCKNKALDAKLSALRQQLAECTQPSLPLHLESELMKNFTNGAFKLSDTARWQGVEEIAKVTQAFCAVVNCNGTSSSVSLLLKIFKRYMMVLKIFLDQPTDEKATWIPRALIVAGCIVRFFDFASIKNHQDVASHEVDSALSDRESLFTWCAACFANNNREGIKRGALHALGSIFVREPKLMLNATVVKLMKKCLAPDEPQAPQLQVLKNFNDHFLQEEADIVARTAAQSEQGGTVELVSDTSTSLMHQFHSLILESSLSPAPRVREQAVKLVKVILHRGLTASYLCIPYLLAQQCKVDSTALEAIRVLEAIHQREASRFTPDVLWDGIQKAYRMCSAAKELPLDAFAAAFRLLASSDKEKANKAVRLFLEMAIKPFGLLEHTGSNGGTHSCSNTLDFKYFVAKLLAQLPYQSMDSVLMLIKMIQDRASSLGGSCIEGLGRFLGASAEEEDKNLQDAGGLRRWIGEAQCLSLLVQLDKFLQDAYSIKPDRMRKFLADSKTLDKSAIKDATLKERTSLEISIHFATCVPNSLMLSDVARSKLISEYKSLRDLMRGNFVVDAIEDVKLNDQVHTRAHTRSLSHTLFPHHTVPTFLDVTHKC